MQGFVILAGSTGKEGSLSSDGIVGYLPNVLLAQYTLSKGDLTLADLSFIFHVPILLFYVPCSHVSHQFTSDKCNI